MAKGQGRTAGTSGRRSGAQSALARWNAAKAQWRQAEREAENYYRDRVERAAAQLEEARGPEQMRLMEDQPHMRAYRERLALDNYRAAEAKFDELTRAERTAVLYLLTARAPTREAIADKAQIMLDLVERDYVTTDELADALRSLKSDVLDSGK